MEQTWRMSVNEKKFIETALQSDLRIDGRRPFDFRRLTIKFARDGSSEVQLGNTHVMAFVTSQLVQPYKDRPNEGTLSIFTEFSPMADPSFEAGRPGESAVELGRIIDRGLRESRAVDTESLCVLAGKLVWAIRIDLHILDNGGNLVDASNIAALAALLTFRRPECTLGGEDGQEVIVHPPEVREPLPLIIHHLPIAVTFGFIGDANFMVVDPTHFEESVMGGKLTATLNTNGDICAIQKAGGVGVMQSVILQCLRIASVKAGDITSKIRKAAEIYSTERALKKIKRHSTSTPVDINTSGAKVVENQKQFLDQNKDGDLSCNHIERLKLTSDGSCTSEETDGKIQRREGSTMSFVGGPSSWDPYSNGINSDLLRASLASHGTSTSDKASGGHSTPGNTVPADTMPCEPNIEEHVENNPSPGTVHNTGSQTTGQKTLKDAVKPKNKRRKKALNKAIEQLGHVIPQ